MIVDVTDGTAIQVDPGGELDLISRPGRWVLLVSIGWPFGLVAAEWLFAGSRNSSTVFAWIGTVVGVMVAAISAIVARSAPVWMRLGCFIFTVFALVIILQATRTNWVERTQLADAEPTWPAALNAAHVGTIVVGCESPPASGLDLSAFGAVDRICGTNATSELGPAVEFLRSGSQDMLVYYPHRGMPPGSDNCAVHISGPWWQEIPVVNSNCPTDYEFVPGA